MLCGCFSFRNAGRISRGGLVRIFSLSVKVTSVVMDELTSKVSAIANTLDNLTKRIRD